MCELPRADSICCTKDGCPSPAGVVGLCGRSVQLQLFQLEVLAVRLHIVEQVTELLEEACFEADHHRGASDKNQISGQFTPAMMNVNSASHG